MKKTITLLSFILYLCAIGASHANMGTKTYRDALKKCDAAGESRLENQSSTNDIKKTVMNTSNCYMKVGNSVIKKYYNDTFETPVKSLLHLQILFIPRH